MISLYRSGSGAFRYMEEILSHAGIAWRALHPRSVANEPDLGAAIIIPGDLHLTAAEAQRIRTFVAEGGALVVTGGTAGLDDLLGTDAVEHLTEGYLAVGAEHPVTSGLTSSLHVFGGRALRAQGGTVVAQLLDADRQPTGFASVVIGRHGKGVTLAIGPDLPYSVLHIQQGAPVWEDGVPPPDGTCPIDEGILKCDDGLVLSYEHDRARQVLSEPVADCPGIHPNYPQGDTPWFMQPIADELRELLLKAICWAVTQSGKPVARLDYWPGGVQAVGLISHDSDLNLDAAAQTTLRVVQELGINTTWCVMIGPNWPDRWLRQTYEQIKAAGHEIALHYNALPLDGGFWGREEFLRQLAWLKAEAGVERILSNKNHYTRWEGKLEFFRWMEQAGLESDQTKGPSKRGNVGYANGSCLPWFPFDAEEQRYLNVLEIPMQTQDLWLTAPYVIAEQIITMALKHRGVAHFLFHQNHIHFRPEVQEAMRRVVADGLAAGLQWWTGEAINHWERLRRTITVQTEAAGEGRLRLRVQSPVAVPGAQLSVVLPDGALANGEFHGLPAYLLTADLGQGETLLELAVPTTSLR